MPAAVSLGMSPASPIVAWIGSLQDVSNVVTMPFKRAGSVLYLIGHPQSKAGGSVLVDVVGRQDASLPHIRYEEAMAHHEFVWQAAQARLLRASHAIGNGGLLTAVCKMAFGTVQRGEPIGAQIDDPWQWTHGSVGDLEALFGETGGFIVEVAADDVETCEGLADNVEGVHEIGVTIAQPVIAVNDQAFDLRDLYHTWHKPLQEVYP